MVYELIAEKEIQMFHRGGRSSGGERGSYSSDSSFSHGHGTSGDADEVHINDEKQRKRS